MMKTMTLNEFKDLIENGQWQHQQYLLGMVSDEVIINTSAKLDISTRHIFPDHRGINGIGQLISTCGSIKITYGEEFFFSLNRVFSLATDYPCAFVEGVKIIKEEEGGIRGFDVLDNEESGERIYLRGMLPKRFCDIDYAEIRSQLTVEELFLDIDEGDCSQRYIEVNDGPRIYFKGEMIAEQRGNWCSIALFKTESEKFICCIYEATLRIDFDSPKYSLVGIYATAEMVKDFFDAHQEEHGYHDLLEAFYVKAAI